MRIIIFLFFCFFWINGYSQQLNWEWSINPTNDIDVYSRVREIKPNIFQIDGRIGFSQTINITRINKLGDTLMYLNLNQLNSNYALGDHELWGENGFILGGIAGVGKTWLAGFDSLGSMQWEHNLNPAGGFSIVRRLKKLNDGGYLFVGERITDNNQFYADIHAGRLDSLGNILWEKYFPILYNQTAHDFVEMPDGSFFISGYSETVALGATPYIMQIDIKGNLIAEHYPQINGFANMNINYSRIDIMEDGNAILAGHSSEPIQSRNAFITKINNIGGLMWDTLFFQGSNYKIRPLSNGGVFSQGFTLDSALFLMELDQNGDSQNHYRLPYGYQKQFNDIVLTTSGFMIGVGFEQEPNPSFTELYAARYDSVGEAFVPDYCAWNLPEATFYYDYQAPILTLYDSSFSGLQYHDSIYQFQWYTSQGDTSFSDSLLTLFDTTGNNSLVVTLIVSNWHGCMDTLVRTLDFQPSGTLNTINDLSIRMYPNPAASLLRFEIQDKRIESISIRVLDLNGKGLFQKECKSSTFEMDISKLSSGIYITEISTNTGTIRKKLIKK